MPSNALDQSFHRHLLDQRLEKQLVQLNTQHTFLQIGQQHQQFRQTAVFSSASVFREHAQSIFTVFIDDRRIAQISVES